MGGRGCQERLGLLNQPKRLASGYRQYSPDVVPLIRGIKQAQELGFTLNEIKQLIALRQNRFGNAVQIRSVAEAKLRAIDAKIRALRDMRDELETIVGACDCGPDDTNCRMFEVLDRPATDEKPTAPRRERFSGVIHD